MIKYLKMNTRISFLLAISFTSNLTPQAAFAQSNSTEQAIGAAANLLGILAQGAAKGNAQKAWSQLDPQVIQCVNTVFEAKNVTADQFVAAGMAPNDARLAPIINMCSAVLTAQPKENFPCNVTNSKGQEVPTKCVETFAVETNGTLNPVSRDDFLRAVGNDQKVQIANFETQDAQNSRLQAERLAAEAERQRYLASPEGKRQVALEAAEAARRAT